MTDDCVNEVSADDRRHYPRARADIAGKIYLGDNHLCDCAIVDASAGGFKLRLKRGQWLPASFTLQIPMIDESLDVAVEWTAADTVGVSIR